MENTEVKMTIKNGVLVKCETASAVKELVVPPVTAVAEGAFSFANIEKIVLPAIKRLEKNVFAYSALTEFAVPHGVEYICADAFRCCRNLKKVFIPDTVKVIEIGAFDGCLCDMNGVLFIYLQGVPQAGWASETKIETVKEEVVTPDDDAFNFHRSSGSFTSHAYEHKVEKEISWCTDRDGKKFIVMENATIEQYEKKNS